MSDFLGHDVDGWDHDTGKPGIQTFGNAIQVWAILNSEAGRPSTVAAAAEAFSVAPRMVLEAVAAHYWMYLEGPDDDYTKMRIEHEGE